MTGALQVIVLCLISGVWIAAKGECVTVEDDCGDPCPAGWAQLAARCYQFQKNAKSWADAERHCTLLSGNLASIQSPGQYAFLRDMVYKETRSHREIWLGGYDAVKNGVWLWSDGSQFLFTGWARGEPNDHWGEGCMEMNHRGRDYINDSKCPHKKPYICARDP
ncbi:ladderlectin-like isoform X2 [Notolabrus celidotus]|nr:ladderlectin-like isoform X2 [Notolabrus celidotus]